MAATEFRTLLVGRVLLAHAPPQLTVASLTVVLKEVAAARKRAGEPLLYWPILSAGSEVPSAEVRASLGEATETLFRHCEAMTLIIPEQGIKANLMRTLMRGMVRAGGDSHRVRIVDSVGAAVEGAGDPRLDAHELERAALAAGFPLLGGSQAPRGSQRSAR